MKATLVCTSLASHTLILVLGTSNTNVKIQTVSAHKSAHRLFDLYVHCVISATKPDPQSTCTGTDPCPRFAVRVVRSRFESKNRSGKTQTINRI